MVSGTEIALAHFYFTSFCTEPHEGLNPSMRFHQSAPRTSSVPFSDGKEDEMEGYRSPPSSARILFYFWHDISVVDSGASVV